MKLSPKAKFVVVAMVAILALGAALALAADPEPTPPVKDTDAKADVAEPTAGRSSVETLDVNKAELEAGGRFLEKAASEPQLQPMMVEIDAVMQAARDQVTALQDRFDREPNPEAALAIGRQIEQAKVQAELDILRIQANHARAAGDEELAQRIEADITFMTTPRPQKQPIERPATDADNR